MNGTTLPSAIVGQSGKLLLEFRSDCGTAASGWTANWTCSVAAPACDEPTGLNESNLSHNNVLLDWNDVAGAGSYQVKIKRSLAANWDYYNADPRCAVAGDGCFGRVEKTILLQR